MGADEGEQHAEPPTPAHVPVLRADDIRTGVGHGDLDREDRVTQSLGSLRGPVPVRTILATIAMVLATLAALWVLQNTTRIISWFLVAGFFAVVLSPPVDFLCRRLRMRRGQAAGVVFLLGIVALAGLMYAFIRPIVDQTTEFVNDFPQYVEDAENGTGTVGRLVERWNLDEWVQDNQERLRSSVNDVGRSAVTVARSVFNTVAATITIAVLSFLMLLEGPAMLQRAVRMLSPARQVRATRLAKECAQAVTGYVAGNLTISVIAGVATYIWLWATGIRFRGVLALWVGFADLIPLVGATLGAIPAIGVAFLSSVPLGIATIVFYVVYQQFENQVLQVTVMARTVALSPLAVLGSVLVGVELFGLLGALLAIPAAGIIKVLATEAMRIRRPDLIVAASLEQARRAGRAGKARTTWRDRARRIGRLGRRRAIDRPSS